MNGKVRIGVLGTRRGLHLASTIKGCQEAEIAAVCDLDPAKLSNAGKAFEGAREKVSLYEDFDSFLSHDFDVAIVANYATEHTPYAIRLLDAGRHVFSEVAACQTLAEAVSLAEAAERNPKQVYAFGENYCYFRSVLEMRRLFKAGAIGELLHAEGEYVHDCESIWPEIAYGEPGHWRNWVPSTFYCTHSLGPLMSITGTRPVRVSAYEGRNIVKRSFGARSADGSAILCQMDDGSTVKILPFCNYRRHPGVWYSVYGSKGTMETDRWNQDRLNVFVEEDAQRSDNLAYTPRMPAGLESPGAGHGGSDYVALKVFIDATLGRQSPSGLAPIDVYQALDMSLPGILGYRSILKGNIPLEMPDFRQKAMRDKYRHDDWSLDPKKAPEGERERSCSNEDVEIPASVYERQRELWIAKRGA